MCAFFNEKYGGLYLEEKYMEIAIEEATKSFKKGDVPVGAVIVKDGKIISRAHNKKEKNKMATSHAEIIAIQKACKKNNNWRLDGCEIYITLEPCLMCYGAILETRMSKIVYGASSEKYGFKNKIKKASTISKDVVIVEGICKIESQKLLKSFFVNKRK